PSTRGARSSSISSMLSIGRSRLRRAGFLMWWWAAGGESSGGAKQLQNASATHLFHQRKLKPRVPPQRGAIESASIDAARCAVLSMDLQAGIVSVYAKDNETLIRQASSVLDRARAAGITVIHVRVAFRPGLPEVSDRNQLFSAIKGSPKHQQFFE